MAATTKGPLRPYCGCLSAAEVAAGMNAALENARRLAADAALLFEGKRFPSSASLAILAIEEVGKVQLLRRLSLATNDAEAKSVWREIRSHRSKNGLWILPSLASGGTVGLFDLAEAIDPKAEHASVLDAVKQIGFYSDCYGDRHWANPTVSVDGELANSLVCVATALSKRQGITTREMELWVEIMRPWWKVSGAGESALLRWHAAMVEEGLSSRKHEEFIRFVQGKRVETPESWRTS